MVAAGEIEDVVDHLEGQPELATKTVEIVELGCLKAAEHPGCAGAVGNQRRRFAIALFEIGLEALASVVAEQALADLPIGQIHDHPREQLHHLEIIEIGKVPTGLGKQKIASQHRNPVVEAAVNGIHPAAGGGPIHHVVVDQRGGVNHLGDLGQAPMARTEFTIHGDRPGKQQHDAGAQPLAPRCKQVLGSGLKNRMASPNQAAQIGQQGIQISLHGLEQLCNRCHNTSAVHGS